MNRKILWKIETLWEKYYTKGIISGVDILPLYDKDISSYNSDFRFVESFDFSESLEVIHEDSYGKYRGLLTSQVLKRDGKYIYLFDNHNKIMHPILEFAELKREKFDVVHIDAHDDDAVFSGIRPKVLTLGSIQESIHDTRISDFFDYMSETNVINNIHRYTRSVEYDKFVIPENSYILSLDIDIFGEEGDFIDIDSKVRIIADAWKHADCICIAMSPGFIDQKFAAALVSLFVN